MYFAPRLQAELKELVKDRQLVQQAAANRAIGGLSGTVKAKEVEVKASAHARCGEHAVWYGASAVAQLKNFKTHLAWTRSMYAEHGPNIVYLDEDKGSQENFWGTQIDSRMLF